MQASTLTAILKVCFMALFFAIVTIVGTLPIRSKSFKSNPKLRIIGSTFAGALFINVAILHILPESADTLEEYLQDGDPAKDVFPLANLLLMVGFLITIFFTKIMTTHQHIHEDGGQHTHSEHGQGHQQSIRQQHQGKDHTESLLSNQEIKTLKKDEKKKTFLHEAYVLTVAIYFHTIFEGIAIGVQTEISEFLSIAVAIAFHKWADALSMGCHYKAKHIPKKTAMGLILGQAILNVLSIGLGWIIAMSGDLMEAIFLSLSAGTFLAISTMELLSEQLHHREFIYTKYLLLILSTVFISGIWFVQNAIF